VITKPEQHDIDAAGKRLLREALESLKWVVNEVETDYGIDFNVQVFERLSPTGDWFHVQLKSSADSEYSADSSFISQRLSIDHARHYALEMRDPVFLIHADVIARRLFWHAPQLDRSLISVLSKTIAESVIVRIPTNHELPKGVNELLRDLESIYLALGSQKIISATPQSFEQFLKHIPDEQALQRGLQKKNDMLKLRKIVELFKRRKLEEARPRAELILSDPDSDIETKFWTRVQLGGIEFTETAQSGKVQTELSRVALKHAKALRLLTKDGPGNLKFYALISRQAAELDVLVAEHETLFMTEVQHLQGRSISIPAFVMYMRRTAVTRRILKKYNQCLRLIGYAASYRDQWTLGRALTNVVMPITHFLITLDYLDEKQAVDAFTKSALKICQLAARMCIETGDSDGTIVAIIAALSITRSTESEAHKWAVSTANRFSDSELRSEALRVITRAESRWKGKKVEGDFEWDSAWQIVQKIAAAQGIDLGDETDPFARALRLAAKDHSPEHILVDCEHILVTPGKMGPIAQAILHYFNMTTAGSKVVHCTLHNFHLEAKEQDVAYAEFKRIHCDSCADRKPRPKGWRYTEQEIRESKARHCEFVARLVGTPYGYRPADED
jgi:hypothetical protein